MVDNEKTIFEPLSEQECVDIMAKILAKYDVIGLIKNQKPSLGENIYAKEAKLIEAEIVKKRNFLGFHPIIQRVFESQFNEQIGKKLCRQIVREMIEELFRHQDFYDFLEDKYLKGKVQLENSEYRLTVHPGFVVTTKGLNTFINGKFYFNIDSVDLLQVYISFAKRGNRVFVQYKHPHLLFNHFLNHPRGYFKEIKKKRFSWFNLKHRDDIESIFDNQWIIYSPSMDDSQIINSMSHQGITRAVEKVLFSPDRKHRLIIYKNESGSFSFHEERLTINDLHERAIFGTMAFWEQIDMGASFYESLDNLLRDLKVDFKDWKSDAE